MFATINARISAEGGRRIHGLTTLLVHHFPRSSRCPRPSSLRCTVRSFILLLRVVVQVPSLFFLPGLRLSVPVALLFPEDIGAGS